MIFRDAERAYKNKAVRKSLFINVDMSKQGHGSDELTPLMGKVTFTSNKGVAATFFHFGSVRV